MGDLHKEQLIALVTALECPDIPSLLEKSPHVFYKIGETIKQYAMLGSDVITKMLSCDKTYNNKKESSNG